MAVKHHFANSSEPLKEGSTIEALCGVDVQKAAFVASLDCSIVGYSFAVRAIRGMCRKCNDGDLSKRFVYVIAPGQEAMIEDS
jgi:hypothetical protein